MTAVNRGIGTPNLGKMNPVRQRDCLTRELCQVCGRSFRRGRGAPEIPRIAFVWPTNRVARAPGVLTRYAITEPWACPLCASITLRTCPGIARKAAEPGFQIVRVFAWTIMFAVCEPSPALKKMEIDSIVGYGKLGIDGGDELSRGDVLAMI